MVRARSSPSTPFGTGFDFGASLRSSCSAQAAFIPRLRRFAPTLRTNGDGDEDRWWPPFTVRFKRNAGL